MKHILTMGLLASTMLSLSMPAVAEPTNGRDDSPRAQRNGGEGQRFRPVERQRGEQSPAREQRAAPAQQSVAPAVRMQSAPASDGWRGQRGAVARPGTPEARANGQPNWQNGRGWSDNRGVGNGGQTTRPTPTAPQVQPRNNGNWQRDARQNDNDRNRNDRDRNWNNNDRARGGQDRNWNNNDRSWSGNDRNRNDRDRNWNNNDRGRDYSAQRRLQDRDRWANQRRWSNDWRNDRRYDWQDYRAQNRSYYRLPSYRSPYGWNYGYSRFSIGIFLNNLLFDQSYWISDPYYYRLPPAYGSMRWVRYYDDALLVDIRDGYVVDVIHGFFW
jgi:hypothetical protein